MTIRQAAKRLNLGEAIVQVYARAVGLKLKPWRRSQKRYDLSEADLERVSCYRKDLLSRAKGTRSAAMKRNRPWTKTKPDHQRRICLIGHKREVRAMWEREATRDKDYFGKLRRYTIGPKPVHSSQLTSLIPGGPVTFSLQWGASYPDLERIDAAEELGEWKMLDCQIQLQAWDPDDAVAAYRITEDDLIDLVEDDA